MKVVNATAALRRALYHSNNRTSVKRAMPVSSSSASFSTGASNNNSSLVDKTSTTPESSSSSSPRSVTTTTTRSSLFSPSPSSDERTSSTFGLLLNDSSPPPRPLLPQQRRSLMTSSSLLNTTTNNITSNDSSMIAANDRQSRRTFSNMKDEYGSMTDEGDTYVCYNYKLENGYVFDECQLRYKCYGSLNQNNKNNVLVVCHALTGNASLDSWWGELLGEGRCFDTSKYYIVCCNILGSCYGSTSPSSINKTTNQPYGKDFPNVSVKDTVRLQLKLLKEELGIESVKCVIGGSFGGMQAVEFAVQAGSSQYSDFYDSNGSPFVRSVVPIACGSHHTAWQIAISEVQRQAIYADSLWEPDPFKAMKGLSVARQIGMISYRTADGYQSKFGREIQGIEDHESDMEVYGSDARWQVKSYLEYQGQKFLSRFDPVTYVKMTEQMDSHNVARGRGSSIDQVLSTVTIPALVMGIDSDVLYPLSQQEELASQLPNGELRVIASADGHDGFLLEQEQVARHITEFLESHE